MANRKRYVIAKNIEKLTLPCVIKSATHLNRSTHINSTKFNYIILKNIKISFSFR